MDLLNVTSTDIIFDNPTYARFVNNNGTESLYVNLTSLVSRSIKTSTGTVIQSSVTGNYNLLVAAGQTIIITGQVCTSTQRTLLVTTILFFAIAIVLIPLIFFFARGELKFNVTTKSMLIIFIGLILGLVFIGALADSVTSFCGA